MQHNKDLTKTKAETKTIYQKNNPGRFKTRHNSWRNPMEKTATHNRLRTNIEKYI